MALHTIGACYFKQSEVYINGIIFLTIFGLNGFHHQVVSCDSEVESRPP